MSTEENKAVVRRFITEVLEGGDLDTVDDVLAPDYVNTAMGVTDLAGFKAMWPAMGALIPSFASTSWIWWPKGMRWSLASRPRSPSSTGRRSMAGA